MSQLGQLEFVGATGAGGHHYAIEAGQQGCLFDRAGEIDFHDDPLVARS